MEATLKSELLQWAALASRLETSPNQLDAEVDEIERHRDMLNGLVAKLPRHQELKVTSEQAEDQKMVRDLVNRLQELQVQGGMSEGIQNALFVAQGGGVLGTLIDLRARLGDRVEGKEDAEGA